MASASASDSGPQVTLCFEEVGDISLPLENSHSLNFAEFNAVHQVLIVLSEKPWSVWAVDPRDASHRLLYDGRDLGGGGGIEFNCNDPRTGDVVLRVSVDGWTWQFVRLHIESDAVQISDESFHDLDFWNCTPFRLVYLMNGQRCIVFSQGAVGHFDESGRCLAWVHTDELPSGGSLINSHGMFIMGSEINAYLFEQRHGVMLAGGMDRGCADGVGGYARFQIPDVWTLNDTHVYASMEGESYEQMRFIRLDLKTLRVVSMLITGVNHGDIEDMCASDTHMYAFERIFLPGSMAFRLVRAPLGGGDAVVDLIPAVMSLDLTDPVQDVSFRFTCGKSFHMDRRTLVARSEYFSRMLSSGMREGQMNEIDLTGDSEVDAASFSVILRFLLSDAWEGPVDDVEFALRVRSLADRYQLPKLVGLANSYLHDLLGPETVLTLLTKLVNSGCWLEHACWKLLEADGSRILQLREDELGRIIEDHPELGKRMVMHFARAS